jgi:hypothetical protein
MNLEGNELHKITVNLDSNLTQEDPLSIVIQNLLSLVKIPDLGGLIGSFANFLPQSLIQLAEDGIYTLLSPQLLQQVLQEGLNSVSSIIETQITNKLNELMSIANTATDTAQQAVDAVVSAGTAISELNLGYLNETLDKFLQTFNITGVDLTSIANVQSAATSIVSSLDNLTPGQIKDLADPAYYQQVFNETLNLAKTALSNEAIAGALNQILPSSSITSMVSLAEAGVSLLNTGVDSAGNRGSYDILTEVHIYYGKGDGADSDAAQKKTVSGQALQSGSSCAVDNSLIMIGSSVKTSLGTFKAVDKTKIASTTGLPVVELFFEDRTTAIQKELQLTQSKKKKQVVQVTPSGSGTYNPTNIERRGVEYDLY